MTVHRNDFTQWSPGLPEDRERMNKIDKNVVTLVEIYQYCNPLDSQWPRTGIRKCKVTCGLRRTSSSHHFIKSTAASERQDSVSAIGQLWQWMKTPEKPHDSMINLDLVWWPDILGHSDPLGHLKDWFPKVRSKRLVRDYPMIQQAVEL